ncbi:membrane protein [Streptomyces longisporoflavus]|uniref:DMT family transporter n=1 Tax=Streptomyces longisporoflavus TaxID=28044 RepID=UPI00167DF61F|nr:DMT family transporter [Streptomyces longisporoflavus]GGV71041.1 membrane protein [Streptomyces longisporoflavus]
MRLLSLTSGPLPAAALVVTWSSGFIGARLGTDTADTLTVLMWRFLIVAALVGPWWWLVRRHRHHLTPRDVATQAVVGLLAQSIYLLSSVKSIELGVPVGTTSLIESLQPLVAGALVGPLLKERVSGRQWIGLVLGLIAVAMVIGDGLSLATDRPGWIYAVPFIGMATLTAATLLQRGHGTAIALTDSLAIQCCTSAVLFTCLGLASGHAQPPSDGGFWVALLWMVFLSTFGGYGFYWLNLKHHSVTRVNSLIYLCPPTTAFWAFLMFGDPLGAMAITGFVISLSAVLLVNRPAASTTPESGHDAENDTPPSSLSSSNRDHDAAVETSRPPRPHGRRPS